jgi:hypothetical protein
VLLDIREETKLLGEVKDILDEIKMIRSVLADQRKVLDSKGFEELLGEDNDHDNPHPHWPRDVLDGICDNIEIMETHAKSAEDGVTHLLDLKQKQANLWEARSSREQAVETSNQGNVSETSLIPK